MFGSIGPLEILLLAGLALVVIGPDKFPEFAKIAAQFVRDLRGYVDETKRVVTEELKPVKKELGELSRLKPEDVIDHLTRTDSTDSTEEDSDDEPKNEEVDGPIGDRSEATEWTEPYEATDLDPTKESPKTDASSDEPQTPTTHEEPYDD